MLRVTAQMALFALICSVILGPFKPVVHAFTESYVDDVALSWRAPRGGEAEVALAMDVFRQAVYFQPNNHVYHMHLAYMYANYPNEAMRAYGLSRKELFEELLTVSKRARTLEPNDLSIAVAYANNFNYADRFGVTPDWDDIAEAWEYCIYLADQKVSEEGFDDSGASPRLPLLLHLARTAIEMGHYEEANKSLRQAKRIMPESVRAKELCQLLENARNEQSVTPVSVDNFAG